MAEKVVIEQSLLELKHKIHTKFHLYSTLSQKYLGKLHAVSLPNFQNKEERLPPTMYRHETCHSARSFWGNWSFVKEKRFPSYRLQRSKIAWFWVASWGIFFSCPLKIKLNYSLRRLSLRQISNNLDLEWVFSF